MANYRRSNQKQQRSRSYDKFIISHLHDGCCLPCLIGSVDHSDEVMRPIWERLRDTVLPAFVKDHPGQRPHAWWAYDAPGRRERVDGGIHPFDNKARTLHVAKNDNPDFWKRAYSLMWGVPRIFVPPFDNGIKYESYEPEWSYLQRHGLLVAEDSP